MIYQTINITQIINVNQCDLPEYGFYGSSYIQTRSYVEIDREFHVPTLGWFFVPVNAVPIYNAWYSPYGVDVYRRVVDYGSFQYVNAYYPTVPLRDLAIAVSVMPERDYYFRRGITRLTDQLRIQLGISSFDRYSLAVNDYQLLNDRSGVIVSGFSYVGGIPVPFKGIINLNDGDVSVFAATSDNLSNRILLESLRERIRLLSRDEAVVFAPPRSPDPILSLPPELPVEPSYEVRVDNVYTPCMDALQAQFLSQQEFNLTIGDPVQPLDFNQVLGFVTACRDKDPSQSITSDCSFYQSMPNDNFCRDRAKWMIGSPDMPLGMDPVTGMDRDELLWQTCSSSQYLCKIQ